MLYGMGKNRMKINFNNLTMTEIMNLISFWFALVFLKMMVAASKSNYA